MAILKMSKSGKALLLITDEGDVFLTSKTWAENLMNPKKHSKKKPFLLLTRMPGKVDTSRFQRSPVFNPETGQRESQDEVKASEYKGDALSDKFRNEQRQKKAYKDKVVW